MRAFISHCGLNSVIEAVHAGVPLLCVPLFGDQFYNAAIVEHRRVGVMVDHDTVTREQLVDALTQLTGTDKFELNKLIIINP